MKGIELKGKIANCFQDKLNVIKSENVVSVCKKNQGEDCTCRYLMLYEKDFVCAKKTELKETIDEMVKNKIIKSKGDNCEGIG